MSSPRQQVTRILSSQDHGLREPADKLVPLVYEELREIAARYMRRENPGHSLQATALVHEAYLRLVDQDQVDWRGRTHFLAVAAKMMPRVLVDHARRRLAAKRRHDLQRVSLDGILSPSGDQPAAVDVMALADALDALRAANERQARVIELRFFAGLSVQEAAQELNVSSETVKRDSRFATAWLRARLKSEETG